MTISKDLRKNVSLFVLALFLCMALFNLVTPVLAYATAPTTSTSSSSSSSSSSALPTVNIDGSGNLSISGNGFTSDSTSAWNNFLARYKAFIVGISGIGAVTMVVLFIIQFLKLGASAGNPTARSQALSGVLWTGIAAAGLGAVSIIVGFFYNAVNTAPKP